VQRDTGGYAVALTASIPPSSTSAARPRRALRRTIQAICEGRDPGDLTTLDDPAALAQIRGAVEAG